MLSVRSKLSKILDYSSAPINFVDWNPRKKLLFTGGDDKSAFLLSFNSESLEDDEKLVLLPHESQEEKTSRQFHVLSSDWNATGDKLVTSANDNLTRVWNDQGSLVNIITSDNMQLCNKWSKSGSALATGGYDCKASVYDSQNYKTIQTFKHSNVVVDLDWRSDNELATLS